MTAFVKPPEPCPQIVPVKFLRTYSDKETAWDCWRGSVATPIFLGRVTRHAHHNYTNNQFPERRYKSRLMAGRGLL